MYLLPFLHTLLFLARFPVEPVKGSMIETLEEQGGRKCGHFLISQSGSYWTQWLRDLGTSASSECSRIGRKYCQSLTRKSHGLRQTPQKRQILLCQCLETLRLELLHLMLPWLLPESGSRVLTTGSSSSISSSASWDALSDMDSLFSLPRLTILRNEGRLEASASPSVLRFPLGRLSLRSSLRRPVILHGK